MPSQDKTATSASRPTRAETEISFIEPPAPDHVEIPEQKEHYQLPTRFGVACLAKVVSRTRQAGERRAASTLRDLKPSTTNR